MYTMRDRLLNAVAARDHAQADEISRHLHDATHLAAALAKLQTSEEQLRTLQATLIAERVARSQVEQRVETESDAMKECRNELASAVRALRRARDEGKRTEEEKRRLQRSFDEAQRS
jgi:septation ring formation regulator EzrA